MLPHRKSVEGRKRLRDFSLGRRGAILCVMGVAWMLLGLGSLYADPAPGTQYLLHMMVPPVISGSLWILSGVIAIIFAFRNDDAFGFLALYIMPAIRCLSYFLGWLDYLSPVGSPGYERGWLSALFYLIMILFIVICAGWPEPPKTPDEVLHENGGVEREGGRYQ